jgi:hypothetical protein
MRYPECTPGKDCGSWMSTPYFLSYLAINAFIMINMCVAVVLGNFAWIYATEKAGKAERKEGEQIKKTISAVHLRNARNLWDAFDRRGTGYIIEADLCAYMVNCPPPLGLEPRKSEDTDKSPAQCKYPLELARLKQQVACFPFSRKGFCRFQDVVTARLVQHMGRNVISDSESLPNTCSAHVLQKTNEPILRFQSAIRLVIDQLRIQKHQLRKSSSKLDESVPSAPSAGWVTKSDSELNNLSQTLNEATDNRVTAIS